MKIATASPPVLSLLLLLTATFSSNQVYGFVVQHKTRLSSPLFASTSSTESIKTNTEASTEKNNMSAPEPHHHVEAVYETKTVSDFAKYKKEHAESIERPAHFWSEQAKKYLTWERPFDPHAVMQGSMDYGDITWFRGGKLNVCYNAVDRHVNSKTANELAMVCEGDEPGDVRRITYAELLREVSQIANALKAEGVKKGDVVTIYMPMIPELAMTMLACARIGAVHSVVFAGFSSEALANRIHAAQSHFVVTADQGLRGSKKIPLKDIVDDSITKLDCNELVEKVLVFERHYDAEAESAPYEMKDKDVRMNPLLAKQRPYCVPETMDAEDNLFILYTSGSTGKIVLMLCACAADVVAVIAI